MFDGRTDWRIYYSLVGAYARGAQLSAGPRSYTQQQKTSALGKPDVDLFIARTDGQPAKVTVVPS